MIEDALRYPTRGDDAATTVLIGGGLGIASFVVAMLAVVLSFAFVGVFLLPFALVPGLFLQGYLVSVVRHRLDGDPEPPRFTDWAGLFVDGLKSVVVAFVYSLPAVAGALLLGVVAALGAYGLDGANVGVAFGSLVAFVGVFAMFLYGLLVAYVFPAAVANWVREDDLTAAFSLSALRDATIDSRYLFAWVLAVVVALVGGTVGQALVILFFVGFFVMFYVQVVTWYLYAEGYAEARELDRPDADEDIDDGDSDHEDDETDAVDEDGDGVARE